MYVTHLIRLASLTGAALFALSATASASPVTAAQREIARAPALPGATEVNTSPTPSLDDTFGPDMVVDVNRWWTAPATVDQALAFLRGHPPVGMTVDGTEQGAGPGSAYYIAIIYGPGKASPDLKYELFLYVVPWRGGVAIRANIQDTGRRVGGFSERRATPTGALSGEPGMRQRRCTRTPCPIE